MKLSLLFLVLICSLSSPGQEPELNKQKKFRAFVTDSANYTATGYLSSVSDSAIWLTAHPVSLRFNVNEPNNRRIDYSSIKKITIRRKGSTGRGILFGALAGIGAGVAAGLISGGDPPCGPSEFYGLCDAFSLTAGEKAVVLAIPGALAGAITGGIIGAVARKKFVIGGSKEKFEKMNLSLLERMYAKPRKTP